MCIMGSATSKAEGIAPNVKHNSIIRLAPLNFLSNKYSSGSRKKQENVPPTILL